MKAQKPATILKRLNVEESDGFNFANAPGVIITETFYEKRSGYSRKQKYSTSVRVTFEELNWIVQHYSPVPRAQAQNEKK